MEDVMMIKVLLFGPLAEAAGATTTELEVTTGADVRQLLACLQVAHPALEPWLAQSVCAVNQEYAALDQLVSPQDEVAIVPPVSGG